LPYLADFKASQIFDEGQAWWGAVAGCVVVPREPNYPSARTPMSFGAEDYGPIRAWQSAARAGN